MSRMFRIISGGNEGQEPLSAEGALPPQEPCLDQAVPFVEVGGPEGLVSSIAAISNTAAKIVPNGTCRTAANSLPADTVADIRSPKPVPPAAESPVLSVTFHRFPQHGLRVMDNGVAPEIVAYHFPDHPVSHEYRLVRDEVLRQYETPGPKVVAFTSAATAAGTTTVLLNVAATLTQDQGYRVLVIDANAGRPGVARRLSAAETPGLAEVLRQTLPLSWALQPTPLLNLHVLAGGNAAESVGQNIATDFPRLVSQLRQWFDWVLIDAGVWHDFPASDGTRLTCDGIYLVTRETELEKAPFAELRAGIVSAGGTVRGYISTRQ